MESCAVEVDIIVIIIINYALFHLFLQVAKDVVTVGAAVSTVGAVVGRRAAACAESLTDEQADQLAQQLAEMCPKLDFDPDVGLTRELLGEAFEAVDGQYEQLDAAIDLRFSLFSFRE